MASQDRWRLANPVITKKIAQQQSKKGHIASKHGKHANSKTTNFCLKEIGNKKRVKVP